jgi:hypothetical protein
MALLLPKILGIAALVAICAASGACTTRVEAPQRLGPPLFLEGGDTPRLWVVTKQEEQRIVRTGRGGRFGSRNTVGETRYHFDLNCHDARTAARVWQKRLLTLKSSEGGNTAAVRILGPAGDLVWLFVRDQPVALSAKDGSAMIDGAAIAQRNAALAGVMPREQKFFLFDDGLVILTADGRRRRVQVPQFTLTDYKPPNEDQFRRAQYNALQWNGGFSTKEFTARTTMLGGRWIGLFTEREAADAGNDQFGDRLPQPERVLDEGRGVRRQFWTARIGKTREFTEGARDRLFDVTPVASNAGGGVEAGGVRDYIESGFIVAQGTKQPRQFNDPLGLLVLHRTRIDAEGRLALTRVDEQLHERWTATLPIQELQNRYEIPGALLLYGSTQLEEQGITSWQEFIVNVSLGDGKVSAWNVTLEQPISAAATR